jgi:hypothetical protein
MTIKIIDVDDADDEGLKPLPRSPFFQGPSHLGGLFAI